MERSGPPLEMSDHRTLLRGTASCDSEFAPRALFTAYLRGTVQWPQMRGGANIHLTAALFAGHGWVALDRYILSKDQVSQSVGTMRALHDRVGIRPVPVELVQADWEKAIAVAGLALRESNIENPHQSPFCRAASAAAKEILDRLSNHSHLFVLSFWGPERIKHEVLSPSLQTIQSLTQLELDRDLLKDPKLLRHTAKTAAASALCRGLEERFPNRDINWLLTDFKL